MASNDEIVHFLTRLSSLMELNGDNPFRVRALANAARMLDELEVDAAEMVAQGTLTEVEGIGKGVEELITEFSRSGTAEPFEALKATIPESLLDLLRIPGLGTKKVKALYDSAGISSLADLRTACSEGGLDGIAGFGVKTQENILNAIARMSEFGDQFLLNDALSQAEELCDMLRSHQRTQRVSIAGSLRRRKEIVKDIDLVLSSEQAADVAAAFAACPAVENAIAQGDTKTSVRLRTGIQADLRIVSNDLFPSLLHHFTGSKDHNVHMRSRALAMGMRLNEYGLCHEGGEPIPCVDEVDLFSALGLAYIPPELREGLGEVEAAEDRALPKLVELEDIRGMLHVHTTYSDGRDTLEDIADAVRARGFSYVGICDHSKSAGYVFGLKPEEVLEQHAEIDALNSRFEDFSILKGIESDIRRDGQLDYDDELLASFDFVVIAVHNSMNMDEAQLTRRVIRAMEHPSARILAHPMGRILNQRPGFPIDLEAILAAAAANNVALELNAQPSRLDLDWRFVKKARELGVKIAINTDAHSVGDLDFIGLGVSIGRKGWLEPSDVINGMGAGEIYRFLRCGRHQ